MHRWSQVSDINSINKKRLFQSEIAFLSNKLKRFAVQVLYLPYFLYILYLPLAHLKQKIPLRQRQLRQRLAGNVYAIHFYFIIFRININLRRSTIVYHIFLGNVSAILYRQYHFLEAIVLHNIFFQRKF